MNDIPNDLLEGYHRFRAERFVEEAGRYRALAEGQSPRTMVIACADSRVDPGTIFGAHPGGLFVVRNVAAIVPPHQPTGGFHGTSAAVEFAVDGLKVENIVVMGHALCGGVAAALKTAQNGSVGDFIRPWVGLLDEARDQVLARHGDEPAEAIQRRLEHKAVENSIANLKTFPFVRGAMDGCGLTLHGAWFSIAEGALYWLEPVGGQFVAVPTTPA